MMPREIQEAFSRLGGKVNKRLGQHFLIDERVLETIVEAAEIRVGDRVLEIGPGLGVLTQALIDQGAVVTAIEQDRRMVEYLSSKILQANVIHGDASRLKWKEIMEDGSWKFISNLPYVVTSLALRKALWTDHPPTTVVVLIQREVAERIVDTKKTSLLSLMIALASESAEIVSLVPSGAFYPAPKVESAIMKIIPLSHEERVARWRIDPELVMALAKKGFAYPRKLLASNLALSSEQITMLTELGVSLKARAENLSARQWTELARNTENKHA